MTSPWSVRTEVAPATSRLLIERAHEELLAGNAGIPGWRTSARSCASRGVGRWPRPPPPKGFPDST